MDHTSMEVRDGAALGRRFGSVPRRAAAFGSAVALVLAALGLWQVTADAAGSAETAELVPISPCRLFDTRPGASAVGTRHTPLGADETAVFDVHGAHGDCAIPPSATAIVANVTAVGATAATYLTLYPDGVTRPKASNLNPAVGAAAVPNQVTVRLSDGGRLAVYNLAGRVDVILDIAGYYQPAASTPSPVSGHEVVLVAGIMHVGDLTGYFSASCPAGKRILGGGVATFNKDIQVTSNTPLDDGVTWAVQTRTFSNAAIAVDSSVNVRVICADASTT